MTFQELLNTHCQIFPRSCPASAMELVGKIHGRIPVEKTPLQDKYKEEPIGFSKLFELDDRGLKTKQHSLPFSEVWAFCESENREKRFPMLSLPTESRKLLLTGKERLAEDTNHIFITHLNPKLTLVGHAHGANRPILCSNLADIERQILALEPNFRVSAVSYTLGALSR